MTKKGKEFFRLTTALTEPIARLAVADRRGRRGAAGSSAANGSTQRSAAHGRLCRAGPAHDGN
jgi:hypothetical protein